MKFKINKPQDGDTRVVRKFALLPKKTFDGTTFKEYVWLAFFYQLQRYNGLSRYNRDVGWAVVDTARGLHDASLRYVKELRSVDFVNPMRGRSRNRTSKDLMLVLETLHTTQTGTL
jgi:hypothetical protein